MTVRSSEDEDPMTALNRGFYVATGLSTVGFFFATWQMLRNQQAPVRMVLLLPGRFDRHYHQSPLRLHY